MSEKLSEVWECYDMEIASIHRGRGIILLKTDKGLRALQPVGTSESRLELEAQLKENLYHAGYERIDRYIRNREEELITCDRYHTAYVLKEYYDGWECNIRVEGDMVQAVANLARLHRAMQKIPVDRDEKEWKTLRTVRRRNREMKRVQNYMRQIATKSEFDYLYLSCFEGFYHQALQVGEQLEADQQMLMHRRRYYCHGAYHQHNVLNCKDGMATVNFEHFTIDNQLVDLYTFLRKAMEKNEYQAELLFTLLDTYDQSMELTPEDYRFLYYLLWYPEKFWKISNQYNNMNKAWIPPKTYEKLETVIRQEEKKEQLLEQYRQQYGIIVDCNRA